MTEVTRIGVFAQGKLMGALYFLLGIVIAICFFGLTQMMPNLASSRTMGMNMGIGFLLIAPFIYGVIGFIAGVIVAWLYNLAASIVGGMQLELQ